MNDDDKEISVKERIAEFILYAIFVGADAYGLWPVSHMLCLATAVIGLFALLHYHNIGRKKILVIMIASLGASAVIYFATPTPIPTLKDFFENDWPNLPSYYQESRLTADTSQPHSIEYAWRLNGDYESQARFLAIYLNPGISTLDATRVCDSIAASYEWLLASADGAIELTFKKPTETTSTHFKDMVFSKRIYVYYENLDFSDIQKGEIEALFQKRGLSVIFRGHDYAWEHRKDNIVWRTSPLTPNSVSLPDPKLAPGIEISGYNPATPQSPFHGWVDTH